MKGRKKQSGVVLIVALMILSVASVVTVSILKDLQRDTNSSQVADGQIETAQILLGGEAWAMAKMMEIHQNPSMATPKNPLLPLVIEQANFPSDLGGDIQVTMIDRSACIDVNNLFRDDKADETRAHLVKLSEIQGVSPSWVSVLEDWGDTDQALSGTGGREDEHYQLNETPFRTNSTGFVSYLELGLLGIDQATLEAIYPHICFLPRSNAMSTMAMSEETLKAVFDGAEIDYLADQIASGKRITKSELIEVVSEDNPEFNGESNLEDAPSVVQALIEYRNGDEYKAMISTLAINNLMRVDPVDRTYTLDDLRMTLFKGAYAQTGQGN